MCYSESDSREMYINCLSKSIQETGQLRAAGQKPESAHRSSVELLVTQNTVTRMLLIDEQHGMEMFIIFLTTLLHQ